jgi:hypothetical protein
VLGLDVLREEGVAVELEGPDRVEPEIGLGERVVRYIIRGQSFVRNLVRRDRAAVDVLVVDGAVSDVRGPHLLVDDVGGADRVRTAGMGGPGRAAAEGEEQRHVGDDVGADVVTDPG